MAELVPFSAIRYAATRGRALGLQLAPPYDQVNQEQRDELLRRSPHNVIHLTLGETRPGDVPGADRYTRASGYLRSWLEEGVLRRDPSPAIYPLEQSFWSPDGRNLRRRGFIAAVRLHPFSDGIIVPHEKTLLAPKADRLENLKHLKADVSPLFGLYRDDGQATAKALDAATAGEPVAETDTEDGVHQRLFRTDDPALVAAFQDILAPRRIFIADGHHRYESSLAYERWLDETTPGLPATGGHHHVMMYLCPMNDPGLFMFATHRLLFGLEGFSLEALLPRLERFFRVEVIDEDLRRPAGRAWAISKLAEHGGKASTFLMVTAADQRARLVTLRDDADLADAGLPASATLQALDVTVLHSIVLQGLLGCSPEAQARQEHLTYVRDTGEAVNRVLSGEHQVGFLLNPTPMWQVEALGDAGETMPQKSTLFHPRLWSGLAIREIVPTGPA
ncbi:MAG: DUF1015 domain-containing protein [Anaeromyxobacteraceae bacterium]